MALWPDGEPADFNEAVRALCDSGFIEVGKPSGATVVESRVKMHRCVHKWTVHLVNQKADTKMAGVVMECVGRHALENNVQHLQLI